MAEESNMGSLFDDVVTDCRNSQESSDKHTEEKDFELVIEAVAVTDVLAGDKERFNTNNIWTDSKKPDDYEFVGEQCNTCRWIDKFHQQYSVVNIPVSSWMKQAWGFGVMTGKLSKLHSEDVDSYVAVHNKQSIKQVLESKKHFIRSDHVSLKRGVHNAGPYSNLKMIVESLITTDTGHSVLNDKNFESGQVKLYLMEWRDDMVYDQEFRVFVHNRKITAISQQHLYSVNTVLNELNEEQREFVVKGWVKTIQDYFEKVIVHKLDHVTSYCIDFAILRDGSPYFIEINPFGREYSSGSALFGWIQDDEILYGKTGKLYFRYTCRDDDECKINFNRYDLIDSEKLAKLLKVLK
ncbi:hypothetical protein YASMINEVIRUS_1525 [Yasminevirus sp. GU-2018]|uniref:Uncharacterized protein n=1 Tax=Yasminevirus sp. GU-2018 TaxID=2420051 RepID=A0A5K0UBI7_9VIRU|nr:hypothetical protein YASMINEVIRUS_1525 [Yasminevirus sp. GU-2018]